MVKQIQQRYRNSKPVADTCHGIKQVHDWAEETIKETRKKGFGELPLATTQEIQDKFAEIKELVNELVNPQKLRQQQTQQQQAQQQAHQRLAQQQQAQRLAQEAEQQRLRKQA